jgi:hypothetical protein
MIIQCAVYEKIVYKEKSNQGSVAIYIVNQYNNFKFQNVGQYFQGSIRNSFIYT